MTAEQIIILLFPVADYKLLIQKISIFLLSLACGFDACLFITFQSSDCGPDWDGYSMKQVKTIKIEKNYVPNISDNQLN